LGRVVQQTCNPSTREIEAVGSWLQGQPELGSGTLSQKKSYLASCITWQKSFQTNFLGVPDILTWRNTAKLMSTISLTPRLHKFWFHFYVTTSQFQKEVRTCNAVFKDNPPKKWPKIFSRHFSNKDIKYPISTWKIQHSQSLGKCKSNNFSSVNCVICEW
jgi:hypothetical protein